MIATVIASILLLFIVVILIHSYELDLKNFRRDLEKKIDSIQFQIDGSLGDIQAMNQNVLNTYRTIQQLRYDTDWTDKCPVIIWHEASEEPICGRDIIAVDFNGYALSGAFRRVEDNKGVYYNCFYLCDWNVVSKWTYVFDILPGGGQ